MIFHQQQVSKKQKMISNINQENSFTFFPNCGFPSLTGSRITQYCRELSVITSTTATNCS